MFFSYSDGHGGMNGGNPGDGQYGGALSAAAMVAAATATATATASVMAFQDNSQFNQVHTYLLTARRLRHL